MLSGRTALVTGSTSGIGLGMARALAAQGADVVLNGFGEPDEIAAIVADVEAQGVSAFHSPADLRVPGEIESMMADAADRFGRVDILVNNAGIQHVAPVEEFPPDTWDDVLAVNLSAAFHTIRLALPAMREAAWGRIVNVASAHGLVASVHKAAYVAAKHGMIGLTKVVGLETARSPVTCNAICPGWVLTPLVKAQIEARAAVDGATFEVAAEALLGEKQPSAAFVTPEQLGEVLVFLCSDAAGQVRGASWTVDGGWCAQ